MPSVLTFAYQGGKYDKFNYQLQSNDDTLRTKVLIELNEDYH